MASSPPSNIASTATLSSSSKFKYTPESLEEEEADLEFLQEKRPYELCEFHSQPFAAAAGGGSVSMLKLFDLRLKSIAGAARAVHDSTASLQTIQSRIERALLAFDESVLAQQQDKASVSSSTAQHQGATNGSSYDAFDQM
ncbi:hypothetical protein EV182_001941 [Spiromyces aspiralis]|uniref:Uncharacterized protein n=1 Tax=Spiromyces aspiralis TaxID=68401 RepID=A0ACC1HJ02_9FUNG|nr:hypothetical protein EV182_001941 [Spiromyces aspiralis]